MKIIQKCREFIVIHMAPPGAFTPGYLLNYVSKISIKPSLERFSDPPGPTLVFERLFFFVFGVDVHTDTICETNDHLYSRGTCELGQGHFQKILCSKLLIYNFNKHIIDP